MNIKLNFHKVYKIGILVTMLSFLVIFTGPADAGIPNEYKPNHETSASRNQILGIFVEIEAANKIGKQLPSSKFSELSLNFQKVFPKYPQDYAFKVVYEQCILLSNNLAKNSSGDYLSNMSSFTNNCQKSLTEIIKKFNSEYTVIATIKASPKSGNAPLTVTLDARGSIDPSNETIPSENFYRYYRDINGVDQTIGKGLVISRTFTQPGNYLVHLTVRSSNKTTKNIFDGDATVSIDVSPKTANISIYANGQKFKKDKVVKVGTQEAKKGVVFDATATMPMGGREIMGHIRNITSRDGFKFYRENEGKPGLLRVSLSSYGEYFVELTTIDNEDNKVSEKYTLSVTDPIAIINQTPEVGTTSTTFSFDANASYSVISNIRTYKRELFNQDGDKVDTYQGKSIKQIFSAPGSYTVKLTVEDELGQTNSDSAQIYVSSTEPIAQFEFTPYDNSKNPSKFKFDASASSDIDVSNGSDILSYERIFPESAKAKIVDTQNNNKQITVEFDNIGTHKIKLIVKDKYGKIGQIEKDINILSTLRPEVIIRPQAAYRGNDVLFVVKSNKEVLNYKRDLGDQNTHTVQEDRIKHKYAKAGIYPVVLKVSAEDGTENEVYKNVFIGEKNYPIVGYRVLDSKGIIMTENEVCSYMSNGGEIKVPAYQVERQNEIKLDPSLSQNTKGENSNLSYYFQPKDGDISKQNEFVKKFDELGCTFIDLTIDDNAVSKQSTSRVRFKVVNSLPKIDNLLLVFPQYGNEVGIGFNQNDAKDVFNEQYDPLIVKTLAQNPIDLDSQISYFKWYYYEKNTPENFLEIKITPGNIPYAFFSVPNIAGEYMFGVTIYDTDGGYQSSEDIIGNGPVVFFPPNTSKPDIPIVTLKSTVSSANIGDEVTFQVIGRILSDRPDFIKERTIYYDFDGDGTRDKITKDDKVTHIYAKASPETGFRPRVAISYRGYKGVANGQNIIIKKGLKPMLLFESFDKTVIFRDISMGDVITKMICMDIKSCKINSDTIIDTGDYFSFTYPSYGKYYVNMELTDRYANKTSKRRTLEITTGSANQGPILLSIPRASSNNEGEEIIVGKSLKNTVLYNVIYNKQKKCYIDLDEKSDTNGDQIPNNDQDFACNQLYFHKYDPRYESTKGKIYYEDLEGKLASKSFSVSFIDFEVNLDPETKKTYDDINNLLETLNSTGFSGQDNLKNLLINLRDGLLDKTDTKSNIVSLKYYIDRQADLKFSPLQESLLNSIFMKLSDKAVIAAQGGNDYQKAKAEILQVIPSDMSIDIIELFQSFEQAVAEQTSSEQISQQDKRKEILQKIVDTILLHTAQEGTTPTDKQIDRLDFDEIIKPNICIITKFYNIISKACPTEDIKEVPQNIQVEKTPSSNGKTSRIKIILRIIGSFIGIFVLLIIIFAVRAKIKQAQDNAGEPTQPTPQ